MDGQLNREKQRLHFGTEMSCYLMLQQAMYIVVTYLYKMTLVSATKCGFLTADICKIIKHASLIFLNEVPSVCASGTLGA